MSDETYGPLQILADHHNLIESAVEAVTYAMMDGQDHGYTDDWRTKVSIEDHLKHALEHVKKAVEARRYNTELEIQDLCHAICRLSMAKYLLEAEEENRDE